MLNLDGKSLVTFSILIKFCIYVNCIDSEEVGRGLYSLYGKQTAEPCNTDIANGPLIPCADGLICNPSSNTCTAPPGGKCSSYVTCSSTEYTCYNSTCMLQSDIPRCNNDPSMCAIIPCPPGTFCDSETDQICSIPANQPCNGTYRCESTYVCHNGYCTRPQLFEFCLSNFGIGPSCSKPLHCHPNRLVCLVPEGGRCKNSDECGGDLTMVCRNQRCRKPGLRDKCTYENIFINPATICENSLCDPYTKECRIPAFGDCENTIDCFTGLTCRCETNQPCVNRKCSYQRLGEYCNIDSKIGSVLNCGPDLTCDTDTNKCKL